MLLITDHFALSQKYIKCKSTGYRQNRLLSANTFGVVKPSASFGHFARPLHRYSLSFTLKSDVDVDAVVSMNQKGSEKPVEGY